MIKRLIGVFLAFWMVLSGAVGISLAADFMVPEDGGNITVLVGEKVKNLYGGGNVVTINADVKKSLYLGGNTITVSGDVENDLFVGGGTVIVRGDVGGSVHVGGGTVVIEGKITDDLFVGGGNIMVAESASVGGDLIIGGGMVSIQGPVKGDVILGAGEAVLNSTVGGDVKAETDSLILGEKARIAGGLVYKSFEEAEINEGAVVLGEVEYKRLEKSRADMVNGYNYKLVMKRIGYAGRAMGLLVSLVAGLFMVHFFGKWITEVIKGSLDKFGSNLGTGFLVLVLTPILAVALLISLFGAWIGGFMMIVYTLMLSLATLLASIALGTFILKIFKGKNGEYVVDWRAVVTGVVSMAILGALFFSLGGLVKAVFMLAILGSLYRVSYKLVKKGR